MLSSSRDVDDQFGDNHLCHAMASAEWPGQPKIDKLKEGDVVVRPLVLQNSPLCLAHGTGVQGMLLDLDAATLTVYVNGERKGVMVRPGMTCWARTRAPGAGTSKNVRRLEGPLRWAVNLYSGVLVSIDGPLPLPEDHRCVTGDEDEDVLGRP